MINLNRQRIAVYSYILVVFVLVFGLSFTVQGNKITGSFILNIASSLTGKIDSFLIFILIGFIISLIFSLYVIRHASKIKNEISSKNIKLITGVVVILLFVSFFSFGVYNNKYNAITGFAVDEEDNGKKGFFRYFVEGLKKLIRADEEKTPPSVTPTTKSQEEELKRLKEQGVYIPGPQSSNDGSPISGGDGNEELIGDESDDEELMIVEDTKAEQSTKTKKVLGLEIQNQKAQRATSQLLNLVLGPFAFDYVSDYCEEQWDSSDYAGGTIPVSHNSNTQSLLSQNTQEQNNCVGDKTTASAQAKRSTLPTGFTYLTSWTVTPCKENIQYTIYLANSIDEKIGIATGIANKGITKSESKQFSYPTNYKFICIQVSDNSIGDNGYACFNVVSFVNT